MYGDDESDGYGGDGNGSAENTVVMVKRVNSHGSNDSSSGGGDNNIVMAA